MTRSLKLPREAIYRVNMRDFQHTHRHMIEIGDVDLISRIRINEARAFVANARDVLPFDIGNFNIFFAAGLLLEFACGGVIFGNLKLNYDYFNPDLVKLMRLRQLSDFYNDAFKFYAKDKSREYARSFAANKGNLYQIALLPKFGYSQPTIECYMHTFEMDWQKNAPYEIFVYSLVYQMFLNEFGFKSTGFNIVPNITTCDVELIKTFEYKWNLTPFTKLTHGSEPKFITRNDWSLLEFGLHDHNIFIKHESFEKLINALSCEFWCDMLCLYRIGCVIEDRKLTQETFDLIHDYSLRTFVRDKLVEFGYTLHAVKGKSHRSPKKYKTKMKRDRSLVND